MIGRGLTWRLGAGQLISWGVTYYLIGVLGQPIADEFGWSQTKVHGGFAAALLTMGLASPFAGALIDRHGGRPAMVAGALVGALGCLGLALAYETAGYYAAWIVLGLAMRLTLYDAAFAALARIGGRDARRSMSQITLLGGLASSVFWPIGHGLADAFGWRAAALVYAACALVSAALYAGIPDRRFEPPTAGATLHPPPRATTRRDVGLAGALYALVTTIASFLAAGMSSAMVALMIGLGVAPGTAVALAALRGVSQSAARLCEVAFGARIDPTLLNLIAAAGLAASFVLGLMSGLSALAAAGFCALYGAGNGLATIVRGSLPLALFEPRDYARLTGRLVAPSFLAAAAAPLFYAYAIETFGAGPALAASTALGAVAIAAAIWLMLRFGPERPPSRPS
ncbi:MFS transporter [Methylopila henanensis]|uniref:MFS transporter n=1 Tax=Methylopila henanensis TaxID=873516 RepID=A0ABW4K644_9HYPH